MTGWTIVVTSFALLWIGAAFGGFIPRFGGAIASTLQWVLAIVSGVLLVLSLTDGGISMIAGAAIGGGFVLFVGGALNALYERRGRLRFYLGLGCIAIGLSSARVHTAPEQDMMLVIGFALGASILNLALWPARHKKPDNAAQKA